MLTYVNVLIMRRASHSPVVWRSLECNEPCPVLSVADSWHLLVGLQRARGGGGGSVHTTGPAREVNLQRVLRRFGPQRQPADAADEGEGDSALRGE